MAQKEGSDLENLSLKLTLSLVLHLEKWEVGLAVLVGLMINPKLEGQVLG